MFNIQQTAITPGMTVTIPYSVQPYIVQLSQRLYFSGTADFLTLPLYFRLMTPLLDSRSHLLRRSWNILHWTGLGFFQFMVRLFLFQFQTWLNFMFCPQHCYSSNFINPALWDRLQMLWSRIYLLRGLTHTRRRQSKSCSCSDIALNCKLRRWPDMASFQLAMKGEVNVTTSTALSTSYQLFAD